MSIHYGIEPDGAGASAQDTLAQNTLAHGTLEHALPRHASLGFDFTMAFQPIVNVATGTIWAYEALLRGTSGQSAAAVLARVNDENLYAFDQACRLKAIYLAGELGFAATGCRLCLNFIPGAIYTPAACLRPTLEAARACGIPLENLIFEITEGERLTDLAHLRRIAHEYRRHNFTLALDDFGAGFSGFTLLSALDSIGLIKLDGSLIRGIDSAPRAAAIVATLVTLCRNLGVTVLAECVETVPEYLALRQLGISLMQGYLFARPGFESLPPVHWPAPSAGDTQPGVLAYAYA